MQHHEEVDDVAWIYTAAGQVAIPATLRRVKIAENVTEIPSLAFEEHPELEEVTLSSSVQIIGKQAFFRCTGLKSILYQSLVDGEEKGEVGIPSTVKVIDDMAFAGCTSLARLVLNEGLERIGEYAFIGCDSMSHFRIPKSVNSIATGAFSACRSLISVELPKECSFNINLSGCLSLVSVAGSTITVPAFDSHFFQASKLGSLVDNEADLNGRLNHRFDSSPLNKLCYYQSYHSSDDTMTQLHSRMDGNPLAATSQMDEFGMTPLHILSLSQTPNLDMLLAVMDAGKPGHMVCIMDSFGCTPMDYFCLNRMPNSNEVIRRLFQTCYHQVLGLQQLWEADVLQAIDEALALDWSSRKSEIGRVVQKFERKEIVSLLELCLWKVKIDGATTSKKVVNAASKKEQILADRQRCRIMSGAAVVIPHVLPFLDN